MIQMQRIRDDLRSLARFGALGLGVDRACFSPAYRAAADWLKTRMISAGMAVREDAAGNVIGRLGPASGPCVVAGSHIDSVPNGGIYDGTLGVLAALEVARCLGEKASRLAQAFEVIAFADEEGAFLGELGCRAMIGDLSTGQIEGVTGRDGKHLADAMRDYGLDPRRINEAARPSTDFSAYVELHNEQGPVLEHSGADIGVVTGIAGIRINELQFTGEANHAGTTPVPLRRDAFRAAAASVTAVFERLQSDFSPDLHRITYGAAELLPGAQNVVPGRVRLMQEIRAGTAGEIDALEAMTRQVCRDTAGRHGVAVEFRPVSYDAPASMSGRVMRLVEAGAGCLGYSHQRMPSGAGHDAQVMARVTDCGMIFIPSLRGISHNPEESSSDEQIKKGAAVLQHTLETLLAE